MILIGVCSCARFLERRRIIRETWGARLPEGVRLLFFASEGDPTEEHDLVRLPVRDDYQSLPAKVHAFYRYALAHHNFDFLFKCDDDTYVHTERLRTLPRPDVDFLGSEQLPQHGFASGGAGYLMSRRIVEQFAPVRIPTNGPEDVVFSVLARRLSARMLSTHQLQGQCERLPEAGNDIVTWHWCSPFEMQHLHADFTGALPGPRVLSLHAIHPKWSGPLWLYADGSFWSRGGAAPNGSWSLADDGNTLILQWFHWPVDTLRLRPWGFEASVWRAEFTNQAEMLSFIETHGPQGGRMVRNSNELK